MGVNIKVRRLKGDAPLPFWDPVVNGGASDLYQVHLEGLPYDRVEGGDFDEDFVIRPTDFAAWKEIVCAPDYPNAQLYQGLLNALEADEDLAIEFIS